jgi:hypothetical protein
LLLADLFGGELLQLVVGLAPEPAFRDGTSTSAILLRVFLLNLLNTLGAVSWKERRRKTHEVQ